MRPRPILVLALLGVLAAPAAAQTGLLPAMTPEEPRRDGAAGPGREDAAALFAAEYLRAWSAPNAAAIASVGDFYDDHVRFHGRRLTRAQLVDVKRRFATRWPERDYRPRPESVRVTCDPDSCLVRSIFDYVASNPASGRRARGAESFALEVSFAQPRLHIVSETSRRLRQASR